MSLELMDVAAQRSRMSRKSRAFARLMGTAISRMRARARRLASRNAFMIMCEETLSSKKDLHSFNNSPANTTTLVVPSPTSASCERAISTRVLAAGWTTSSRLTIVAPSLEIVTVPFESTMSLSNPLGPRVVLTVLAIA
eukprot:Pompholyxophrys_sp_v1_NODE_331_length_742_cov_32.136827.p2 type:complete len:139 gc:universal NODE_331_length_742_cov_32.136827:275-691(+)